MAYESVQYRLLQTYLELSDLSEKQLQWSEYDDIAKSLAKTDSSMGLVKNLMKELQYFSGHKGGALLLARGMNDWHTVLSSEQASYLPPMGLSVQPGSIAEQALTSGESYYSTHFNANPKRISAHEPLCHGATYAVPIMHQQRRQLIALVYNENPLVFTEAVKHKVNNLCRITSLKIEALLPRMDVDDDIFATSFGSYKQELFQESVATLMRNFKDSEEVMHTWTGMVTIGNIADLRTKYRLEDLKELQKEVLKQLRPQKYGVSGLIGEYSDYVYTFVLQSSSEDAFDHWCEGVEEVFKSPIPVSPESSEQIMIMMGYTEPRGEPGVDSVIQKAKKAMNEAVKNQVFKVKG